MRFGLTISCARSSLDVATANQPFRSNFRYDSAISDVSQRTPRISQVDFKRDTSQNTKLYKIVRIS